MKDSIILPIRSPYARMIESGEKTVEYRRKIPTSHHKITRVYLYETSPVMGVIGFFCPEYVVSGSTFFVYRYVGSRGGVSLKALESYAKDKCLYAWAFNAYVRFREPIFLKGLHAPQNFVYMRDEWKEQVREESGL